MNARYRYALDKINGRLGQLGPALDLMPRDRFDALLDEAARTGKSLSEILADHWSQNDPQPCKARQGHE